MKRIFMLFFSVFMLFSCSNKEDSNLKEITLVLDWTPNTNHTGIYVADELGYFKEEGLKVNIVQPAEDSSASIVGSGRAEFGVYFQPNMVKRLLKDVPITAVATILQHNTAGIMSLKRADVTKVEDLAGKKYLSWEDKIDDATVKELIKGDYELIPGEATDPLLGLKEGLFDFLIVYYGWDGVRAEIENVDIEFFAFKDENPIFDYYSPVIIANNDFISNNKEITKKMLRALEKGYKYSAKNPEKSAEILIKNAPETNEELIKASQQYLSKRYLDSNGKWGYIDDTRWNNFFKWVYDKGLIDKEIPSSKGYTNDYLQ